MLFYFYLVNFLLSSTSVAQSVLGSQVAPSTCSLASFDRCGPAIQQPGTPSTCNATITKGLNLVYGANCIQYPEAQANLNFQNCVNAAAPEICNKLTDPHVLRDRWIWSNPAILDCSLGFWLPSGNGTDAAFAPDYNRCMTGIFIPLSNYCTNPSWNNAGSVNIKVLPNGTANGAAIDPYYPSYVIAPSPLTTYAF